MEEKAKILLVEDDISLIDGLAYSLRKNGFELDVAMNLKEAYGFLGGKSGAPEKRNVSEKNMPAMYDLLLLDVGLPDGTGFDLCENIRKKGGETPVIFLTALDEEVNVIRGLDGGGDDYITKPFKLGELCSRINALLRRSGRKASGEGERLKSGPVEIDLSESQVRLAGKNLELTGAEYRLLCFLLKNRNRVLTRTMILNALWDDNGSFVDDNTLSVYIRRLREKIEDDPSNPRYLKTVRGFGYQWDAKEL